MDAYRIFFMPERHPPRGKSGALGGMLWNSEPELGAGEWLSARRLGRYLEGDPKRKAAPTFCSDSALSISVHAPPVPSPNPNRPSCPEEGRQKASAHQGTWEQRAQK
ncbi:hypothetical protein JZ751_015220 [Albula glossodonta]|uniref:Uncharacterized protein n=1 Tax=Albula glossodonta TaxID=121402 RepID=A0A8T2NQ47_9TELE|nr:hypothetical protein JZ751_015220 [Albula glossodonta]